jgi:chemotaxis protein MotB
MLQSLHEPVAIAGYTDATPYTGEGRTNWDLSADRANATRRILTAAGLPNDRIRDVTGHGERDLLLPNTPEAPANRRIAILLVRTAPAVRPPGFGN